MRPSAWLGVLVAARTFSAQADVYSWVDGEGVIHLTNLAAPPASESAAPAESQFGGQAPLVRVMPGGARQVLHPVDVVTYDPVFHRAAAHYRLPVALLKAVAKVESNFNPRAVSSASAKGLMQLMDATAERLAVADPFDPEQSIFGGARYLRMLSNQFRGNLSLILAAYNAGPHRVRRYQGVPPFNETRRYVRRVLAMYRYYRQAGSDV